LGKSDSKITGECFDDGVDEVVYSVLDDRGRLMAEEDSDRKILSGVSPRKKPISSSASKLIAYKTVLFLI
jgi:hypothetical protein